MRPESHETEFYDEPSSSSLRLSPFDGVYRIEAGGEEAIPLPSLIDATSEPPMSPEAEIRDASGCLAQATPDHYGWAITRLGAQRIEREAHGSMRVAS